MSDKYNFFSLFSGAGGFSIGFEESGFEFIGASDISIPSELTHKANWPNVPFIREDINRLTADKILELTKGINPDILIGGPPCQGFSVMGDKNSSDPRNELFNSYLRIINELQPKCFMMENVKGFKTMYSGQFYRETINKIINLGYKCYSDVINAKNYGVAQSRERVIIFATKIDKNFKFPVNGLKKFKNLNSYKNVGDAINDLALKDSSFPNHIVLNHSEKVVKRYSLINEGGKLPPPESLPIEIRRKNFGSTYQRLNRNNYSITLVPGNNAFPVHPTLNRSITPREAARIQSFPDKIIFKGNRREQCILVGNAVAPLMSANLALKVSDHLNGNEIDSSTILSKFTKPINSKLKKQLTFVDLFSGAGGITEGLLKSGIKGVLSVDFDQDCVNTHKENHKDVPIIKGDLDNPETKDEVINFLSNKKIDLVIGGPPCQGFSIFGKRRFVNSKNYDPTQDNRNSLVKNFWEYVEEIDPDWAIMENVPGFASLENGYYLEESLKQIKKIGFRSFDYRVINCANYGVPQKRKRFILIASKKLEFIPWPKPKYFQDPEDWQLSYRKVGDVITDLGSEKTYSEKFNHYPSNHSELISRRYSFIEEGKKMDVNKLPPELRKAKNTGKLIKNFSHVYRRLHRDEASITLVPGHNAFPIHPWLNRVITVREAARIQTFSDSTIFTGSSQKQTIQVGNAFPPLMACLFGEMIKRGSNKNWIENGASNLAIYSILDKWYLKDKAKT